VKKNQKWANSRYMTHKNSISCALLDLLLDLCRVTTTIFSFLAQIILHEINDFAH